MVKLKNKIQLKLIFSYLFLILISLNTIVWIFYYLCRENLEKQLGKRLVDIANLSLNLLEKEPLKYFRPGDEETELYKKTQTTLKKIKKLTEVEEVFIFNQNQEIIISSQEGVKIGQVCYFLLLDSFELKIAQKGKTISSVLYRGEDGNLYKSAYALLVQEEEKFLFLGISATAKFLKDVDEMKNKLLGISFFSLVITVVISFLWSRAIVGPIKKLVRSAEQVGAGNFETRVEVKTKDEIGFLAETFNTMAENIKKLYHQLAQEAEKKQSQLTARLNDLQIMASGLAHEIRNSLGGIKLYFDISKRAKKLDQETIEGIETEIATLSSLVANFLDFTRPTKLDLSLVNPNQLLNEAISSAEKEIKKNKITLIKEYSSLPLLKLDGLKIKQAFLNLIYNAVDSMKEGEKKLTLRTRQEEDKIRIEFEDTGSGIPEEIQDKIFSPFFTTKTQGIGLGLSLAHKIITLHQGIISFQTNLEKGTKFTIVLPVQLNVHD
jgi:signal transduction histidine kinase